MTSSILPADAAAQRTGMPSRIFALMPLWAFLIVSTFSSDFFDALRVTPPEVAGIPLAIVIEVGALLWMLVGVVVISTVRSRLVESISLTMFTIPATVVVVLTPAVIGILQHQG
jgi:hypothetical protein